MRLFVLMFVLCLTASAWGTGWNDFELPIDSDHVIIKANSLDVVLCRDDGRTILQPMNFPGLGPIISYSVTETHIFTHHIGRKPRKLFAGDTYEELDPTQEYYFTVRKADDVVAGPFTEAEFLTQPETVAAAPVDWQSPRNPNVVRPVLGALMFLLISGLIFGVPIGLAIVLLIALVCTTVYLRRRHARRPRTTPR